MTRRIDAISLPHTYGYYPKAGDTPLHYGALSQWGTFYLWGTIGNTCCCGSAHVIGMGLYADEIYKFLLSQRVSVLSLEYSSYWQRDSDEVTFKHLERAVNEKLKEVGNIKIHRIDSTNIVILLTIEDEDGFDELVASL